MKINIRSSGNYSVRSRGKTPPSFPPIGIMVAVFLGVLTVLATIIILFKQSFISQYFSTGMTAFVAFLLLGFVWLLWEVWKMNRKAASALVILLILNLFQQASVANKLVNHTFGYRIPREDYAPLIFSMIINVLMVILLLANMRKMR